MSEPQPAYEQIFEIEYVESLNLAPTRVKASSFTFMYDFRHNAPQLIFLDWTYSPVFTHEGLPNIIKAIHFIKEESHEEPKVTIVKTVGDALRLSDVDDDVYSVQSGPNITMSE